MPDPKLEDIYRITLDTNRMVHKMRRSIIWGRFFQIVWWLLILAISGYTYYVYAQPYVDKLLQVYAQIGQTTAQAQTYQSEISSFFGNLMQHQTATTTATTTH